MLLLYQWLLLLMLVPRRFYSCTFNEAAGTEDCGMFVLGEDGLWGVCAAFSLGSVREAAVGLHACRERDLQSIIFLYFPCWEFWLLLILLLSSRILPPLPNLFNYSTPFGIPIYPTLTQIPLPKSLCWFYIPALYITDELL